MTVASTAAPSRLTVHGRYGADAGFALDSGSVLGVYLSRLPGSTSQYADNEAVWLCWTDADNRMVLQVPARARHCDLSGLRVQFEGGQAGLVEQVLALVPRRALADGVGPDPAERAMVLVVDAIRSDFVGACRSLLDASAAAIDSGDALAGAIGAGLTAREALHQLQLNREAVEQEFRRRLTQPWRPPPATTAGAGVAAPQPLINDGEMRAWLAGRMASRALEGACESAWKPLRQTLRALLEGRAGVHAEALSVIAVIDVLAQSLQAAELDCGLQDLLLRRAARPEGLDLSLRYERLLQSLQRAGLGSEPAVAGGESSASKATVALAPLGRAPAPPVAAAHAWSTLRQLGAPAVEGVDPHLLVGGGAVADSMLLRAAGELLAAPGSIDATELRTRMLQRARRLAGNPRATLEQRQYDAIDLGTRMRAALDADDLLPGGFRERCLPLLRPILAMELQGEGFAEIAGLFRQCLSLVEFGSELTAGRNDPATQRVCSAIDAEVEALGRAPVWSAEELLAACERLEQQLQRPRAASLASEKRVVETCAGQQRLADARTRLQQELASVFAGQPLPQALLVIVERRLATTMLPVLLRAGPEGAEWRATLARLKGLRDALRQAAAGQPCADVAAHMGWLQEACSGPPDEQILGRCLARIDSALGGAAVPSTSFGAGAAAAGETLPPASGSVGAAPLIELGDCMVLSAGAGGSRVLKLAWRAPDGGRLVFVNRLGQKLEDMQSALLATALAQGDARILGRGEVEFASRAWRRMLADRHQDLVRQATLDVATGLLNRRELVRRLQAWLVAPEREPLLLLWIELDQLPAASHTHGAGAGQQLLEEFADLLRRQLDADAAAAGFAARVSEQQFVVALPGLPLARAERLAHRFFDQALALEFEFDDAKLRLLPTMGLVAADAATASVERLLADARQACAAAAGPGRWHRHQSDDAVLSRMRDAANWVRRVDAALPAGGLVLYGQRAQALAGDARQRPEYIEVLLRMHSDEGVIAPGEFATAVERYGQIAAMDRHVLQELARTLRGLKSRRSMLIAFNVSARNIAEPEFVAEIIEILRRQPLPLHQLCVEVTESALMQQFEPARRGMQRLADAGLSLALDDFGSGAAALGQLAGLPFDLVKVGGAYLREVASVAADRALLRSINAMAHLLGKRTVAERVEDQATFDQLASLGFDYAQGYLIGQPLPLQELLG